MDEESGKTTALTLFDRRRRVELKIDKMD